MTQSQYTSPQIKMLNISTRTQILYSSISGSLSSDPWNDGSNSSYSFGDED